MLEDVLADPDEPKISILSLQDMARLFVEQEDFADPFISPARGIVHAQWRIDGNGALVWGFLGTTRYWWSCRPMRVQTAPPWTSATAVTDGKS